ncbi:MAG TPA: hypothetical protein VM307_05985 [Egibacteraceae bacterium]|nr:hypothetical protein [Egibacteraceae bacterium]
MRLDEAALDAYTDQFEHDAFRHEVLDHYDVPSDGGDFARWLAGEPDPSPDVIGPWAQWVRAQRQRGASVRRLRVLTESPSEYLRFEAAWAYRANVAAGEDIRVLDLTEQARPLGLDLREFWLLDGQRAAVMTYDDAGRFLYADTIEGRAGRVIRRSADIAWAAAEPFEAWWARHPEYHRARV